MSEDRNHRMPEGVNRLAIGLFVTLWGAILLLQQAGIVADNADMWPYALIYFGTLVATGGILRLTDRIRDK